MRTLLTQEELADRWGVTVKTIREYRLEGIISKVSNIPAIRFNLQHIEQLEGTTLERYSPLERKKMEKEVEKLSEENCKLKKILSNILAESAKVVGIN